MSPKLRVNVNCEYRAAKTVGKKTSGLNSLDQSMSKVKTQKRYNNRNFLPSSSGAEHSIVVDHDRTSLRMGPRRSTTNGQAAAALANGLFPNTAGNVSVATPSISVNLNDQIG